jgi:hypothetical protein
MRLLGHLALGDLLGQALVGLAQLGGAPLDSRSSSSL